MKQNKMYVAPQVDVIMIEPQGILCTSGGELEPSNFTGVGMTFGEHGGEWNN